MTTSPLSRAATRLAKLFREARKLVDLSSQASSALTQAERVVHAMPVTKAMLAAGFAKVEAGYTVCVAAVQDAESRKRKAELAGAETAAKVFGIPDPSSAQLAKLQQRLHTAFKEMAAMLGPLKS